MPRPAATPGVLLGPLGAVLAVAVAAPAVAWATETAGAQASFAAATATVAPPTSVTASASCPNNAHGSVTVSWAASTSPGVTGYSVTRSAGGGAATVVAQLDAAATSFVDRTVAGSTTYTYAVSAAVRTWASTAATASAVTTARHC